MTQGILVTVEGTFPLKVQMQNTPAQYRQCSRNPNDSLIHGKVLS